MTENLFAQMRAWVLEDITALLPELPDELLGKIEVTPTRDAAHGDMATNAAMVIAKPAGKNPRDIAMSLAEKLRTRGGIAKVEPAGPGFVNITLDATVLLAQIPMILSTGELYGDGPEQNLRVNVEYVSANPTGPIHVGHTRGTVVGDALANLLSKAGYHVTREYYMNDAGAQVLALARSVYWRYLQALDLHVHAQAYAAKGLQYGGEYLVPVGFELAALHEDKFVDAPEEQWLDLFRAAAIAAMMKLIREDLAMLGVRHDVFTSEAQIILEGKVERALAGLSAQGLLYTGTLGPPKGKAPEDWEPREQLLFRSTDFGDDQDRPVRKSDGTNTYFANDVAYHLDKLDRGYHILIDVWGADHSGDVKRVKAGVQALAGGKAATLEIILCQIVRVMKDGAPVRMSKRAGTFVELRDLIDEVGPDAVRFIMLMRKSDAQMEFDLNAAVAQTRDNPVFYVQYAHARARSVLRAAGDIPGLADADLSSLTAPEELALVRKLIAWPRMVESAAEAREPHRIAFYLYELAGDFHALWNAGRDDAALRFLQADHPVETKARIALVEATATVIRSGLAVLGVHPVEEMR
jgi:arginyl-tRNA synthetase